MATDSDLTDLIRRAKAQDDQAWPEIVDRFRGLIASIGRSFRLSPADAADVAQTTWLRLHESLDRVHDPERLPAWLATTARRECMRLLRIDGRERPSDDVGRTQESVTFASPGQNLIRSEERATVQAAVRALPERHRRLMTVMLESPAPSYTEVSDMLSMPVGSIGPTRGRALERLRRDPRVLALAS